MSIHVALEHRSSYRFDRPVRLTPHVVRLRPAPHTRTPVLSYSMTVEGGEHFVNWQQDPFGNFMARLVVPEPVTELAITIDLVADLTVINPFDFFLEPDAETYPFTYDAELAHDLGPYLDTSGASPLLDRWVAKLGADPMAISGTGIVDFLVAVNQRALESVAYTTRMEPGVQSPDTTLELALGSCRDSAWLLVQAFRRLGLAARFASGYLVQLAADVAATDGAPGPTADFTDLHAWCEVFLPGAGWIGLDPTSGLLCGEGHIPLACTPAPSGAAPVTGATEPCEVIFEHSNEVRRIHEDPRVTKPYTEEDWDRIDVLGAEIDRRLAAGDVRLTQGGEPTFVSMDHPDAPEWTIAADGEEKRHKAWGLTLALADRFAPGGFIHVGQGKWYPGEPLPRWQLGIHWRPDGEPIWTRGDLIADPWTPGTATADQAEELVRALARQIGAPDDVVLAAHEDRFARLWADALLPIGDPPEVDLDPTEDYPDTATARAAAVADAEGPEVASVAGWVLPLHRSGDRWATSRWTFRRGRLIARSGDSPLGLRLPLDSISWAPPTIEPELSPFATRPPLSRPTAIAADTNTDTDSVAPAAAIVDPSTAPPTAVCVERRDGRIHVFLPPIESLEAYLELIAVVEEAAAQEAVPVVVEGYPPPRDPRCLHLVVTPDPGVIEVNLHPAASWADLRDTTTALYEVARTQRLTTERFELDGTHSGTGGGNHVTLGGPTPADSPLLRRPDLLASMLTYWQHHPSLSYLFSGRFVGPTSQAPRVDEARHDSLDELEIAFAELHHLARDAAPWLVDRLFRNLLVDLTGNTHRAEFCIDKLFSPESERGRLGLLELRAFEMPPHPRLAMVQALLIRAIVLRCWEDPISAPLVRWGTELHQRFLKASGVAADLATVIADLADHGIDLDPAWFAPFLEFRFPRLGSTRIDGVTIELRGAIEPWLVLGEEATAAGTSRYVDSSVERLEVRAEGLIPGRHVITCNGRPVPMGPIPFGHQPASGVSVGGVRYRAWQPPSALHPTIGVHSPVRFDLVDLWSGTSLGGCTYHVTHPGGRSYDTFPVNANEAEARRTARFDTHTNSANPVDLGAIHEELATTDRYAGTLDLRTRPVRRQNRPDRTIGVPDESDPNP